MTLNGNKTAFLENLFSQNSQISFFNDDVFCGGKSCSHEEFLELIRETLPSNEVMSPEGEKKFLGNLANKKFEFKIKGLGVRIQFDGEKPEDYLPSQIPPEHKVFSEIKTHKNIARKEKSSELVDFYAALQELHVRNNTVLNKFSSFAEQCSNLNTAVNKDEKATARSA